MNPLLILTHFKDCLAHSVKAHRLICQHYKTDFPNQAWKTGKIPRVGTFEYASNQLLEHQFHGRYCCMITFHSNGVRIRALDYCYDLDGKPTAMSMDRFRWYLNESNLVNPKLSHREFEPIFDYFVASEPTVCLSDNYWQGQHYYLGDQQSGE